ncbi:geranylgeranyl reductase family protein [Candidatus Thorarchaeota archaeon]|nr:MAG: geranylgeranyl reductase family protein [Candidatus Thorarchaeota archaeon]
MTLKRPDVIIVGAGSAGCVTARRCAELGLRTLLLDRKSKNEVGQKVCGDEISRSHFEDTGIHIPEEDEISTIISGADVYPPNMTNKLRVRGWTDFDGWTVNRLEFGQRLLSEAINAGVKFEDNIHVTGPTVLGDQVTGVQYKGIGSGDEKLVKAKLVVDASGFAATIRNKLDSPLIEQNIDKGDIALCYREILKLKVPLAEPEVARVFLGRSIAPHGYAWIFPKGVQEVNAGIGVTGGEGVGSPKSFFESFKDRYPLLFESIVIDGKGGAVPVRRPLKSLVGNGVAFVGDAALQVNPIHGGGIGAGIRAGIILGEVAREAIARRNLTAKGLWPYNTRFLTNFGKKLAMLEIFRRLLQAVEDEDMNYGFEKQLLEAGDLMSANRGEGISLSPIEKMKRIKRGAGNISLLLKLQKASGLMKKMNKAYTNYPSSPEGLDVWEKNVQEIIEAADFE